MRMTIRTKLLLSHFGVILVACLLLGGAGYLLMKVHQERTQGLLLEFNARTTVRQVEGFLARKETLLEHIATGQEVENFPVRYRVLALGKYFTRFQQDFPRLSFFSPSGREDLKVVRGELFSDQVAPESPPLVQAAAAQPGDVFLGPVARSADLDQPVIPMALGLKRYFGDEFIGVLAGDVPLADLKRELLLDGEPGVDIRLLDGEGRVLIGPRGAEELKLLRLDDGAGAPLLARALNLEYGLASAELMDVPSEVAFHPVPKTGWIVLASLPRDAFLAGSRNLALVAAAVFVLVCAAGLGLAWFLATGLIRPLAGLARAAGGMAGGGKVVLEDLERGDEVGDLARAFKSMQSELERSTLSREELDRLLAPIRESLVVVTLDGTIQLVNEATLELLGYRREELLDRSILLLLAEDKTLDNWFDHLIESRGGRKLETCYRARDGRSIPVAFSSAGLEDAEGNMDGFVCVAEDLRERRRIEGELARQVERLAAGSRDLQDFAFIVSQDLQDPLRTIGTLGRRLKERCGPSPEGPEQKDLARLEDAVLRLEDLSRSLLDLSRVTSREQPFVAVPLQKVAGEALADLAPEVERRRAEVALDSLPTVEGDPLLLRQLVKNLVDNALKFQQEGVPPRVEVRGETSADCPDVPGDGCCQISVVDNGIGFDERYLDRIFGPFQRLHGRDRYPGAGIGLAICASIVRRHHGTITARSRPGQGTAFLVRLPLRQPRPDGPARASGGAGEER